MATEDSYYQKPRPPCCDPFPGFNLSVCSEADSTFCTTCGRWLEPPVFNYHGLDGSVKVVHVDRPKRHPEICTGWACRPDPICVGCKHSLKDHGRSIRCSSLSKMPKEESDKIFARFVNGPHNCSKCDCQNWKWKEEDDV